MLKTIVVIKKYAISKIKMKKEFKSLSEKGYSVSIARLFSFIGERLLKNKNFASQTLSIKQKIKIKIWEVVILKMFTEDIWTLKNL